MYDPALAAMPLVGTVAAVPRGLAWTIRNILGGLVAFKY